MNVFVNKMLDLEAQARRIVEEAKQYYDLTVQNTQLDKNDLLTRYNARAEHHIQRVREAEEAEAERVEREQSERAAAQAEALDAHKAQHASEWRAQLLSLCQKR